MSYILQERERAENRSKGWHILFRVSSFLIPLLPICCIIILNYIDDIFVPTSGISGLLFGPVIIYLVFVFVLFFLPFLCRSIAQSNIRASLTLADEGQIFYRYGYIKKSEGSVRISDIAEIEARVMRSRQGEFIDLNILTKDNKLIYGALKNGKSLLNVMDVLHSGLSAKTEVDPAEKRVPVMLQRLSDNAFPDMQIFVNQNEVKPTLDSGNGSQTFESSDGDVITFLSKTCFSIFRFDGGQHTVFLLGDKMRLGSLLPIGEVVSSVHKTTADSVYMLKENILRTNKMIGIVSGLLSIILLIILYICFQTIMRVIN